MNHRSKNRICTTKTACNHLCSREKATEGNSAKRGRDDLLPVIQGGKGIEEFPSPLRCLHHVLVTLLDGPIDLGLELRR